VVIKYHDQINKNEFGLGKWHVGDSRDTYRILVGRSGVDGRIIGMAWNGLMFHRVGTVGRLL
jgi:hypothetical protein